MQRLLHATRLLNNLRPRDYVTSALKELHWLPIVRQVEYKLCLLVHKSIVGHTPMYIKNLLTAVADVLSRSAFRDASKGIFVVPRTCFKLGERAFFVAAAQAWNRLPAELKTLRSILAFKRALKTFLFRIVYND